MNRHSRAALFLSTLSLMATTACGAGSGVTSTGGGIGGAAAGGAAGAVGGAAGGEQNGSVDCFEEPYGDASGFTISTGSHRITAQMSIRCVGNLTISNYKFTMVIMRDGVAGAGNTVEVMPSSSGQIVQASTSCKDGGTFKIWYTVAGVYPNGGKMRGASTDTVPPPKVVLPHDC